ncbi:DNA polymerase III subunit beta [Candidatus Curtissbacteria bacterium]|nr:DNA polymerase III subunit beta [Candidatus Curtissbacteria bacterium]
MKFSSSQGELNKALLLAGKSLLTKPNLPVLANLLIKTGKGHIEILSTNLETATRVTLPCEVAVEGETTLNGKTLLEFVSQLPEGKVTLEKLGEEVLVSASGFKARLATIAAEEFPAIPLITKGTKLELSAADFARLVGRVAFSAATDEGRPVLTGVLAEFSKGHLKMVATDGYRLSFEQMDFEGGADVDMKLIVPARALIEVGKILSETEAEKFAIQVSENLTQMNFNCADVEFTSRLIEGEYPGWQRVIPGSFPTRVVVNKEELTKLVKVASIFARDAGSIVKVHVEPDAKAAGKGILKVEATASQVGSTDAQVEVTVTGPGGEIAFNYRYMLEALAVIGGEDVIFEMVESLNPGKISPTDEKDKFFHIVMPVRLQS